jgi:succinate dehydrogenase / fumarate reductase cytochrome b subunit
LSANATSTIPRGAAATSRASSFLASSIGRKVVMAVTGVVLVGYVVGHMLGNLQLYLGPEALNAYALKLREIPALLWGVRVLLLASVLLHIWAAASLTRTNMAARGIGYRERRNRESTYASRTMRWSGVILLLFVVYHLLHLTLGTVHPSFVHGDVYHNVVVGLRAGIAPFFYIVAMLALGLHMYHGVWSLMQTVGLSHPKYDRLRYAFAALVTAVVVLGNLSFPIAVMTGLVKERLPSSEATAPRATDSFRREGRGVRRSTPRLNDDASAGVSGGAPQHPLTR